MSSRRVGVADEVIVVSEAIVGRVVIEVIGAIAVRVDRECRATVSAATAATEEGVARRAAIVRVRRAVMRSAVRARRVAGMASDL